MTLHEQLHLPAYCGSVQDLTNPDFCSIGVLASYTLGTALVFVHQIGFAVISWNGKGHEQPTHPTSEYDSTSTGDSIEDKHTTSNTKRYQAEPSFEASSVTLFDTAIVLAFSWQVATLVSLGSTSSIQTTHDVLLVCLTTYASIALSLGALCTSFHHIRRHKYRLLCCAVSLLCIPITALGQHLMATGTFPKETCLPFFTEYKSAMRSCFVALSAIFWASTLVMMIMMCLSLDISRVSAARKALAASHPELTRVLAASRLPVVFGIELLLLVTIVLVNHRFVPEQELRAQAAGQLAESHWTFGQIVGMLIWMPVFAEFAFVFRCGAKEGLEGRLPVRYSIQR